MGTATFGQTRSPAPGRGSPPTATPASGQSLRHRLLTIAAVLREVRQEAGLSQRSLASRLGKANSHVSKIESGQRRVDAFELYLIAGIVGLDPAELFARVASELDAPRRAQFD
ncbi:MAG: helix-turn-helix transcriptional regulator [Caulobacter sp.]|nr:helix-turn-helix transcriptional regulator [Caulobacter sp.]